MNRQELSALPKGTTLYVVSRKISRSGMRQIFDVFFFAEHYSMTMQLQRGKQPLWIRINSEEVKEFNKFASVHACGSIEEDNKIGGSFYVNGCGFDRSMEVVSELGRWATGDPQHFQRERI